MVMGSTGGCPNPREIMQASAEHFQKCAELPLLCNRGLRAVAVTELPIPLARRAAATHAHSRPAQSILTLSSGSGFGYNAT